MASCNGNGRARYDGRRPGLRGWPLFDEHEVKVQMELSDNGRQYCGREHRQAQVSRPADERVHRALPPHPLGRPAEGEQADHLQGAQAGNPGVPSRKQSATKELKTPA